MKTLFLKRNYLGINIEEVKVAFYPIIDGAYIDIFCLRFAVRWVLNLLQNAFTYKHAIGNILRIQFPVDCC